MQISQNISTPSRNIAVKNIFGNYSLMEKKKVEPNVIFRTCKNPSKLLFRLWKINGGEQVHKASYRYKRLNIRKTYSAQLLPTILRRTKSLLLTENLKWTGVSDIGASLCALLFDLVSIFKAVIAADMILEVRAQAFRQSSYISCH